SELAFRTPNARSIRFVSSRVCSLPCPLNVPAPCGACPLKDAAMRTACWLAGWSLLLLPGCATTKSSDTPRTGIEQMLISNATDQAPDKVNFVPIRHAKVFVETKYLDCVDKNYIIVAVHQRLLRNGSTLVEKPEDAQVILELASGAVGTDRQEFFVGIPEIP